MIVLRWFSLSLIVLALMLLGADIISTLEAGSGVVVRSLDKVLLLFNLDPKPWIQTAFSSSIANAVIAVLLSPGWAIFGIAGVFLTLILPGRRERREPAAAHQEH